eukprot:g8630.t1
MRHQIRPFANLTAPKRLPASCEQLVASVGASCSTSGERSAETELRQPCGEDLDLAVRLRLAKPAQRQRSTSLSTSAEAFRAVPVCVFILFRSQDEDGI